MRGPPAEVRTVLGGDVTVRFSLDPPQPRSKGTPTKRVPFSPCTRKSTASRPRSCAAAMPFSTSSTLFTALRADGDDHVAGLQAASRRPGCPRRRPRRATPSPSGFCSSVRPSAVERAAACAWLGSAVRLGARLLLLVEVVQVAERDVDRRCSLPSRIDGHGDLLRPARCWRSSPTAPSGSSTALPLTLVMMSPASMPAPAAGPSACRIGDDRALGALDAEALGDVLGHRLDLHAEPAARDDAVVAQVADDLLTRCSPEWRRRCRHCRPTARRSPCSRRRPRPAC